MPKPTPATDAYRDTDPDAVSLHTTPDDYSYDDAAEIASLPPSYADSEADSTAATVPIRHVPPPTTRTNHNNSQFKLGKPVVADTVNHMDPLLDSDPVNMESYVRTQAHNSPIPLVYIMGTHKETTRRGDKKETNEVTDFRIVINMQRYLHKGFQIGDSSSMDLTTVDNGEKVHRGTIFKKRAPGVKQDIEVGTSKPTVTEWCHRYCASPRMLRIFRLRRVVTGFDEAFLKNQIETAIRNTGYRGHVGVWFPVEDKNLDIYTSNRINQWRLKTWICWIFYLTFLWIFTWPYLFFATKRYAVVRAEWPFSISDAHGHKTYTTVSEDQWMERWRTAIRRMALEGFQGEATEQYMSSVTARPEDPPTPGVFRSGNAGLDSAVGILSQGFQVARAISSGNVRQASQAGLQSHAEWGVDT